MSYYKGFEVDDSLSAVIRYMRNVEHYRDDLQKQQVAWDYLSVLGQLAKLDTELAQTRKEFTELTGTLLNQLGLELLKKSVHQYAFKAQVAINIMIRNLFERTADIGFLATDDDIRAFLLLLTSKDTHAEIEPDLLNEKREYLRDHFRQYAAKYSVYHNIILLDTQGNVLLQLDESNPVTQSKDPLIMESLHTKEAYVENFRHSDLLPNENDSLIFSYRVDSPVDGRALGVICLCFRFENECAGIFANLLSNDNLAIFSLLNKDGRVIASSSENVALNTKFKLELDAEYSVVTYEGEEYFCCSRETDGFQGYRGVGWLGHVMVPLTKMLNRHTDTAADLSASLLAAIMQGTMFNAEIKNIPLRAAQIQRELNRLVWNGNVQQATDKNSRDAEVSKVLLSEIKHTGVLTKQIFEESISDIQKTVIASVLQNSMNMAALAIDIMDRNLYERANDCRWWALTTTFRTLLAQKALQAKELTEIKSIVSYINSLYTVYSNILVFDKTGKVIAVSNPQAENLQGKILTEPWVKEALALRDSQDYVVSDYMATPLYGDAPTYIYATAIHGLENGAVLGGVGIVFDAAPQFLAMLQDVLPKDAQGEVRTHCFSAYTDAYKAVIASSSAQLQAGELLDISDEFFALQSGQSLCKIIAFRQRYYAVGCSKSAGYREYKSAADRYQQEVFSFVFIYLGEVQAVRHMELTPTINLHKAMLGEKRNVQMATFFVDGGWLALRSDQVASAIQVNNHLPIHGNEQPLIAGYLLYKGDSLTLIHTSMLLGEVMPKDKKITEVVVAKIDGGLVGLIVDSLGEMMDISDEQIHPVGVEFSAYSKVVREIVLSNAQNTSEPMLQIIDIDMMRQQLHG